MESTEQQQQQQVGEAQAAHLAMYQSQQHQFLQQMVRLLSLFTYKWHRKGGQEWKMLTLLLLCADGTMEQQAYIQLTMYTPSECSARTDVVFFVYLV